MSSIESVFLKFSKPQDKDCDRVNKYVLLISSSSIAFLAIFWGSGYFYLGLHFSGLIPFAYSVITFLSIAYLFHSKNFAFYRYSQLLLILFLPFLLQWSLGGYESGSMVSIWALFTPISVLFFLNIRSSYLWITGYFALIIISVFMDDFFRLHSPVISQDTKIAFFGLNSIFSAITLFILIYYYSKDRESTRKILLEQNEEIKVLSKFTQQVIDKERKNISNTLHDVLNSEIIVMNLDINRLIDQGGKRQISQEEIINTLRSIKSQIDIVYKTGKTIIEQINPVPIDIVGLTGAIQHHIDHLNACNDKCNFLLLVNSGFPEIRSYVGNVLFRTIKEAINNVIKHSNAKQCEVQLSKESEQMTALIKDNGKGIPVDYKNGIGMILMRENMLDIGGHYHSSSSNNITIVTLTLPMTKIA